MNNIYGQECLFPTIQPAFCILLILLGCSADLPSFWIYGAIEISCVCSTHLIAPYIQKRGRSEKSRFTEHPSQQDHTKTDKDFNLTAPLLWRFLKSWNPYNVKPFLTDISVTVDQIKRIKKQIIAFF